MYNNLTNPTRIPIKTKSSFRDKFDTWSVRAVWIFLGGLVVSAIIFAAIPRPEEFSPRDIAALKPAQIEYMYWDNAGKSQYIDKNDFQLWLDQLAVLRLCHLQEIRWFETNRDEEKGILTIKINGQDERLGFEFIRCLYGDKWLIVHFHKYWGNSGYSYGAYLANDMYAWMMEYFRQHK